MEMIYMRLACLFTFIAVVVTGAVCAAQTCKTDAKVIGNKAAFMVAVKSNPNKKLVALQKVIPGLQIDLRYSTTNNFTHTVLYRHPVAYLHPQQAEALKQVQEELHKKGYALKLYDAFRPFSVTCKIWRLVSDRHYVANPRNGSNHNRGLAVDVTLVDLKTGKELDMGTGFDNFTDSAHDFKQLPGQVLANRRLLRQTMRKFGFGHVPAEWWHYQWHNDADYEVIDLDFDDLKELVN